MKGKLACLLLTLTFLLGCSSVQTDQDKTATQFEKPTPQPQQPQPTSNDDQHTEQSSNLNKTFEIGHWQIILKHVDNPKWPDFDYYNLECTYLGNSKVTHAKISFGNGSVEPHDITHGEGMVIGSTFSKDTKQIDFMISTTEENGETVVQSRVLMTGE